MKSYILGDLDISSADDGTSFEISSNSSKDTPCNNFSASPSPAGVKSVKTF